MPPPIKRIAIANAQELANWTVIDGWFRSHEMGVL